MAGNDTPNLGHADIDRLGKALLTLASEVWTLKDRQRILETVLAEQGIAVSEVLESYQPDERLAAELAEQRTAFIETLLRSLEEPE